MQVLLRTSVDLSITIYGVMSLLCVVASLLLPIETKGREMQVSSALRSFTCLFNVRFLVFAQFFVMVNIGKNENEFFMTSKCFVIFVLKGV